MVERVLFISNIKLPWDYYFNVKPVPLLERQRPNPLLLLKDCSTNSNAILFVCFGFKSHCWCSLYEKAMLPTNLSLNNISQFCNVFFFLHLMLALRQNDYFLKAEFFSSHLDIKYFSTLRWSANDSLSSYNRQLLWCNPAAASQHHATIYLLPPKAGQRENWKKKKKLGLVLWDYNYLYSHSAINHTPATFTIMAMALSIWMAKS